MASSVSQDSANATTHDQPLAEPSRTPTVIISPVRAHSEGDEHVEGLQEIPLVYDEPPRPQAGPLPKKRGEIGFEEGADDGPGAASQASSSSLTLPERHPADRDAPPAASSGSGTPAAAGEPPRSPSRAESTNTANSAGKRSLISFLKPKRIPTYGGLRLSTLAIFLFQLCLFGGTIAGWVLIIKRMQKSSGSSDSSDQGETQTTMVFNTTSAQIFVHVAFAIVSLAEGIFIERSVFRLRAERYAYVHPGEILPSAARRAEQEVSMGLAPWNRPPLPTYAAALAQSGVGTGDVEDNIIAIPPPPAYGNTRGSTLLLSGFLSEALRAQRPRSGGSTQSRNSGRSSRSGEDEGDRPKSYMSTDPEWEARCDADRALVLEETLARLEEGNGRSRRS